MNEELETLSPSQRLAALERNKKRNALISAYEAFERREPLGLDNLLKVVTKFAYTKVYHLEHDFREFGSAETADDWAQEVAFKIWQKLVDGSFEGTGEQFYAYVHKIAFNRAQKAFNKLENEKATKVPLLVVRHEGGDPDADTYEEDNPEIFESAVREYWVGDGLNEDGEVKFKRGRHDFDPPAVDIPDDVQGTDRTICLMIRRGLKYREIAESLGTTENAVKQRMKNLKQRLAKGNRERERQRQKKHAERHQPFKITRPQTVKAAG